MKIRFNARDRGILLPAPPWSGEVLSLYKKAINIRHPENLLISLIKEKEHMTALSICVPSLFVEKKTPHINTGMRVTFEKGKVLLDQIDIDIQVATVWDGSLKPDDIRGFYLKKISLLQDALLREGKRDGLLSIIDPEKPHTPLIEKSAKELDRIKSSRKPLRGFSNIIGLGIGFTPSGDDFITGVLMGERVLNVLQNTSAKNHIESVSIDRKEVLKALNKTNIAGRTLLWQAVKGQFPSYLLRALKGIARAENSEEMLGAVKDAVLHGETSGTDALTGLFWYFNIV